MSKTTIPTGGITADAIDATLIADDAISEEHLDATAITGHAALAESPADTDEFLISDGGTLKRIDASHIGGGRATLLSTDTLSSDNDSIFNSSIITSTYDNYLFVFENIQTGSGNVEIRAQVSTDNGSSLESSSGDYRKLTIQLDQNDTNGNVNSLFGSNESFIMVAGSGVTIGNDAALKVDGFLHLFTPNSSSYKKTWGFMTYGNADDPPIFCSEQAQHVIDGTQSAINYIKFYLSNGNFASGKIKCFGLA